VASIPSVSYRRHRCELLSRSLLSVPFFCSTAPLAFFRSDHSGPWSVGGQAGGDNVDKFNLQLRGFHTGGFCPLVEAQITARLPNLRERQRRFFLTIVDAQLDFERDAGGKVADVVVHQNGRDIRATGVTRQE
jgi:hypothetical protein